jgi:NhaP-type Na+/H+ or K+/H+ antiporter
MTLLPSFIALIFPYSLFSARLEKTILTAPILFTAAGMVVLLVPPKLRERKGNLELFLRLAEVGLVMLLFTDASLTHFIVEQLGYGAAVGIGLGLAGGWLLGLSHRRAWVAASFIQLGLVALPLLCLFAHGLSAMLGVNLYAANAGRLEAHAPENSAA